jgi:hypothetical protein
MSDFYVLGRILNDFFKQMTDKVTIMHILPINILSQVFKAIKY